MPLKTKLEDSEKPKRKPATREEYESALEASLLNLEEAMNFAIFDYNEIIKLYIKYSKDKRFFRIEYYKEDGSFIYTRHRKKKPGFEIPGVKR